MLAFLLLCGKVIAAFFALVLIVAVVAFLALLGKFALREKGGR